MEERDLIVIGGGPAGAAAARAAADLGRRPLLLEARPLPRAKPCGGVIAAGALGLVEERFGPTPDDALAAPALLPVVRVHLGPRERYDLRPAWPAVRVARRAFDAHLLARSGAEVRDDARVERVDLPVGPDAPVRLLLAGGEALAARCVVVAAGAGSALVPFGPGRRDLVFAGRVRYPGRPPEGRELLLLGARALVAIDPDGPDGVSVTTTLKRATDWKLAHAGGLAFALGPLGLALRKERGAEFGWLSRGGPALGQGAVLLAGDAAGLCLALGLGLEAAVRSGLAAGAAAAAFLSGEELDPVRAYSRALDPFLRRRTDEGRAAALVRGRVTGFDEATALGQALTRAPLTRRVVFGHRLHRLVRSLDRAEAPPQGFPV
ncbi:MAG: FAD-dependent oxidoreductase [Planctomycetes bacterium]|nr:FAD-dependent oxidoreductase [Planctomycetota bacterium]